MWLNFVICILHFLPLLSLLCRSSPAWLSSLCPAGKCFLLMSRLKWKRTIRSICLRPAKCLLNTQFFLCPVRKCETIWVWKAGAVWGGVKPCGCRCPEAAGHGGCPLSTLPPASTSRPGFLSTGCRHSSIPVCLENVDRSLAGLLVPGKKRLRFGIKWWVMWLPL